MRAANGLVSRGSCTFINVVGGRRTLPDIDGSVTTGFERVAEAFEENLASREDAAQCCVHVDGQQVVDLWGGCEEDAIQIVFSATKGATAACANLLVQRGLLDLDAPVIAYWPEYGANGKEKTLVRWILTHKAGVLGPAAGFPMEDVGDWDKIVADLAAQSPAWEPGTAYGYHGQTFGWLVGELVRRVDGRSLGTFFAEEIAGPARADFWIGLPESEEHRVVPVFMQEEPPLDIVLMGRDRRYRAAEQGAAGGVSNGRGLSRMYAWLLDAFTPETIADILRAETSGPDRVLSSPEWEIEQRIGRGFMAPPDLAPNGVPTFGHGGAGGSAAFADPERRVAFGYAMTRLVFDPSDARAKSLIEAVYSCLDGN